jgi:hypothetical protein
LICFKLAIVIAAILAGLISNPVQGSENDFPKNSSLTPIDQSYLKKRKEIIKKCIYEAITHWGHYTGWD